MNIKSAVIFKNNIKDKAQRAFLKTITYGAFLITITYGVFLKTITYEE